MEKMCVSLDVKSLKDRELEGLGAVFRNTDLGGDIIAPGAFTKSLKQPKQKVRPMLWMHKPDAVIGRWDSMKETDTGLVVKGVLADTDLGNEIHTLLKMEAVRGLSIGYSVGDFSYNKDGARVLKEIDLWEVSVVSMPMNPLATIQHVKSRLSAAGEYVPTIKEFERVLRNVGCSSSVAKDIAYRARTIRAQPSSKSVMDIHAGLEMLQAAITLHAGHMDGSVDTSDESQAEMMEMMVQAYSQISGMEPMDSDEMSKSLTRNAGEDEVTQALKAVAEQIMADTIRRKVA
jgi:HK97 family phage prohead protease